MIAPKKILASFWIATLVCLIQPAEAQQVAATAEKPQPRVVNVTSDSPSGWIPSVEQERVALAASDAFFLAMDKGDIAGAYDMMSDGQKALISRAQFTKEGRAFRKKSGDIITRKYNQVMWTKDSPDAPQPGTYVAIDITAKYAKVDRFCGYVVLFQPDASAPFKISRIENTYILDTEAAKLKSAGQLETAWGKISSYCPNYAPPELEEAPNSTIGYDTVAEALQDLRSRSDIEFTVEDGWTIATDKTNYTIWSFAPEDYPAYPAVVRRKVVPMGSGSGITMDVHCEASKAACDDLVRAFTELNERARDELSPH